MKKLASLLIRLYPSGWKQRYRDEMEALLEDAPPDSRALFDLLKGGIAMQLAMPGFSRLAFILGTTGLLAGFGVSFLVTPRFISTAVLAVIYNSPPQEGLLPETSGGATQGRDPVPNFAVSNHSGPGTRSVFIRTQARAARRRDRTYAPGLNNPQSGKPGPSI